MKRKREYKFIRAFLYALLTGIFFGGSIVAFWVATMKIPDLKSLGERKIVQSTKIYDRTGQIILWDVHENIQRTVVPQESISLHIKNATVAIEDSSFYRHKGIDAAGIIRAFGVNLFSGNIKQGGSTISQQLVKNTILTTEKTLTRKIKEIILTLKLERTLSKDEILELYLNEIPYGGSNYGVEAASRNFFGKSASDITLAEAAYLASLPKAPTYYSPYGNNKDQLEQRKNLVLNRMAELRFITREESEKAQKEEVRFINRDQNSLKAPHFSVFIRSYLEKKYGRDLVDQGGLKVVTTLDYSLQQKAEDVSKKYAQENKEKFNAKNNGLIAIDPKTGQILTMVGSKDYFNKEEEGNFNVTLAHRQPGSSIKPFIYATAFKKGYTPETIVFDLPTEFNASCNPDGTPQDGVDPEKCYMPQNYDEKFRGPVTLKTALAQSLNVPSVKTLYLTGILDSIRTAEDMGITSLNDPDRYGLTLVLGGGEVSLLELTGAYSVFANGGVRNPITGILKVEDKNGRVLEEFYPQPKQVLEKNIALTVSDILSDNEARTPAFGRASPLYFPERQVAAKTGTTNDSRDAWVIGYTPNVAMGSWFGNNDNSPMEKKVAGFIVAPMWNEFMKEIFQTLPNENFEKPKEQKASKPFLRGEWRGGRTYLVDNVSQKIATEFTPPELITEKVLTEIHSILYWVDKNNPAGNTPSKPDSDPQFVLWETPVREWAAKQGIKDQTTDDIPTEKDDVHKLEYSPIIKIESPLENTKYSQDDVIKIKFTHNSKFGLGQVDFFFNNNYLGSSAQEPFTFSFAPKDVGEIRNDSEVKIIAYDTIRNKTEVIIPIKIKTNGD